MVLWLFLFTRPHPGSPFEDSLRREKRSQVICIHNIILHFLIRIVFLLPLAAACWFSIRILVLTLNLWVFIKSSLENEAGMMKFAWSQSRRSVDGSPTIAWFTSDRGRNICRLSIHHALPSAPLRLTFQPSRLLIAIIDFSALENPNSELVVETNELPLRMRESSKV